MDNVASGSIRDTQRQRVYDAEALAFEGRRTRGEAFRKAPEYKTVAECQEYVDHVTASDAWREVLGVETDNPVAVLDGRGARRPAARAEIDEIRLPRFSRRRWTILHELAHIATFYRHNYELGEYIEYTVAAHGPEYAGVYLLLVRALLGEEAHDVLLGSFEAHRAKVVPIEEELPVTDTLTPLRRTGGRTGGHTCDQCVRRLFQRKRTLRDSHTGHAFCSDECRWTFHNARRRERLSAEWRRTCEVCGAGFEAHRNDARYCSPKCRQLAYRQRH